MSIKIGLNIHPSLQGANGKPRAYSDEEKRKRASLLDRLQSTGNLFMDDLDTARAYKKRFPGMIVVNRPYRDDDGELHQKLSAKQIYDLYARNGEGGLVTQLWNEPTGYGVQGSQNDLERIADRAAEVMDLFGTIGHSIAVPNFGEGHPDEKRLSELKSLFEGLKKWQGLHYYASHEYGTWRGMTYDDPEDKADVMPWRIGRFKFIADHCHQHYGFIPQMLISEWGIDSAHDGQLFRGWRTTGRTGAQYARELIACLKQVYYHDYIKALFIYCLGNTGERHTEFDWWSFDVWGADDFFDVLEAESMVVLPQTTSTPFPENLGEPIQRVVVAAAGEDTVNGRAGAGTDFPLILEVPSGAIVKVWKESARFGLDRWWYPVEYNGRRFWMAQVGHNPDRSLRDFEQQFLPVLTPPEPLPFPKRDHADMVEASFAGRGTYVYLYAKPSTASDKVKQVVLDEGRYIPFDKLTDGSRFIEQLTGGVTRHWLPTYIGEWSGWLADESVIITPKTSEPPVVEKPADEPPPKERSITITLTASDELIEEGTAALLAMLQFVSRHLPEFRLEVSQ